MQHPCQSVGRPFPFARASCRILELRDVSRPSRFPAAPLPRALPPPAAGNLQHWSLAAFTAAFTAADCAMAARLARLARHVTPVAAPAPCAATERRTSGSAGGSPTAHSPANLDRRYLDDEDDGEMDLHDDYFPVEMSESEKFMFDLQGVRQPPLSHQPHPTPGRPQAPGPPPGTWPGAGPRPAAWHLASLLTPTTRCRGSSSSSASFSARTRSAR